MQTEEQRLQSLESELLGIRNSDSSSAGIKKAIIQILWTKDYDQDSLDLSSLELNDDELAELTPLILDYLPDLYEIALDNNQLSMVPSEIGSFKSLKILTLNNNKIITLPPEIKKLGQQE